MPKSDIFAKEKSRNKTHQTISRAIPHEKKKLSKLSKHQKKPLRRTQRWRKPEKVDSSNIHQKTKRHKNNSNTTMRIINGIKIVQAIKSKFQGGRNIIEKCPLNDIRRIYVCVPYVEIGLGDLRRILQ